MHAQLHRHAALLALAAVCTSARLLAQPQTDTSTGAAAFQRGDFQEAAAILGPIADRFPQQDDFTAEYLMAQLYETGRGVPQDRVCACSLYLRASLNDSPYASIAIERAHAIHESLEREDDEECAALVNLGFHSGFERTTIELEPGHWVRIGFESVVVAYKGEERRHDLMLPPAGGRVFLPLERTHVNGRHFIEVSAWEPDQRGKAWTLRWYLFEVDRTDWLQTGMAALMTIPNSGRPSRADIRTMVRLRVDQSGGVEAQILTGPDAGRQKLETASERLARREREQARLDQERARNAALQRIDWNAARDIQRRPELQYVDNNGCARIFLHGWTADRAEAIVFRADQELLGLSSGITAVDLASQRVGVDLTVHVYGRAVRDAPFCTDIHNPAPEERVWRAVAGTVTIELTNVFTQHPEGSQATVTITNAIFMADGIQLPQVAPIVLTAVVGWMAGE